MADKDDRDVAADDDRTEDKSARERLDDALKRREDARRQEREAAAVFDSPAYAKGPQDVPVAGGDADSLTRTAKHVEAATADLTPEHRGVMASAAEEHDDPAEEHDGPVDPDAQREDESDADYAKRQAAAKRHADAEAAGSGQAATVKGRQAAPKSTT